MFQMRHQSEAQQSDQYRSLDHDVVRDTMVDQEPHDRENHEPENSATGQHRISLAGTRRSIQSVPLSAIDQTRQPQPPARLDVSTTGGTKRRSTPATRLSPASPLGLNPTGEPLTCAQRICIGIAPCGWSGARERIRPQVPARHWAPARLVDRKSGHAASATASGGGCRANVGGRWVARGRSVLAGAGWPAVVGVRGRIKRSERRSGGGGGGGGCGSR
jgi:hypothetical protein